MDENMKLTDLMSQYPEIMQGTVGDYRNMEVAFEMDYIQHPYHTKPYRIPVSQIKLMKKAITVMVENRDLSEYIGNSPWTAPKFGVPIKNDEVRIVTNFRKLNEAIKRNPWPIPTIQNMLHQCRGMVYATTLDMIMFYYAMNAREGM